MIDRSIDRLKAPGELQVLPMAMAMAMPNVPLCSRLPPEP